MSADEFNAILAQRIDLNRQLMIVKIKPDGWEIPDFKSGQFTILGLPGTHPIVDYAENVSYT